ncbi:MAG: protein-L-isoaspartate O-methyltransferase [Sphingomonadales bacterium]|nr:protein-L-isoaspartate O-methyltransferase [Sphingomonadales bacterium]
MSELDFSAMRAAMVSNQLRTNKVSDPGIVAAMKAVARERFVPAERAALAYIDVPIPLANGRALNSPLVTARLIAEAGIEPGEKVLLVGAATGYAAALLAELGAKVTALEVDVSLTAIGKSAGISSVTGPLEAGWRKNAPYDVILIDGAVEGIPTAIAAQLADGGRLLTGLVDKGVTRLALGRKSGTGVGLVSFADLEAVRLPGFAPPASFSF